MIIWLQQNWVTVVSPLLVAVADLVLALNPKVESNGIFHWIYLQLGGKKTPPSQ